MNLFILILWNWYHEYCFIEFLYEVDSYEFTSRVYESSLRVEFTSRVYRPPTSLRRLSSMITLSDKMKMLHCWVVMNG